MHWIVLMSRRAQESLYVVRPEDVFPNGGLHCADKGFLCNAFQEFEQIIGNLQRVLLLLFCNIQKVRKVLVHVLHELMNALLFVLGSETEKSFPVRRVFNLLFAAKESFMHGDGLVLDDHFKALRIDKQVGNHCTE